MVAQERPLFVSAKRAKGDERIRNSCSQNEMINYNQALRAGGRFCLEKTELF